MRKINKYKVSIRLNGTKYIKMIDAASQFEATEAAIAYYKKKYPNKTYTACWATAI